MAYHVVWSSKAIEDIDAIASYISRDSPLLCSSSGAKNPFCPLAP